VAFLEMDGVHKYYGDMHVLRGVDLTVDAHEVVCLIGASGCGKSTLLRCVNALEDIQEGVITLGGRT
jgi:polar amino acid transport system ATP-binding protein